jgi:hypothetical protein
MAVSLLLHALAAGFASLSFSLSFKLSVSLFPSEFLANFSPQVLKQSQQASADRSLAWAESYCPFYVLPNEV